MFTQTTAELSKFPGRTIHHEKWKDFECLVNSMNAAFDCHLIDASLAAALETDAIVLATIGHPATGELLLAERAPGFTLETMIAILRIAPEAGAQWICTNEPKSLLPDAPVITNPAPTAWVDLARTRINTEYSRFTDVSTFQMTGAIVQTTGHYYYLLFGGSSCIQIDGMKTGLPAVTHSAFRAIMSSTHTHSVTLIGSFNVALCKPHFDAANSVTMAHVNSISTSVSSDTATPTGTCIQNTSSHPTTFYMTCFVHTST